VSLLALSAVTKRYPGVTALDAVDVAQARTLGERFADESAAVTDYVRRARGGEG
jgi:hypothetical protein